MKKGDLVWVSGAVDSGTKLEAEQVRVKSVRDFEVCLYSCASCVSNKTRVSRQEVHETPEAAVAFARADLLKEAARLEHEAKRLRALAESEPLIVHHSST